MEDLQVCLFQIQITAEEQNPVLGKMGKPVSLTDLFLLASAKWQPHCSHPGGRGRSLAQPLTPQLLPEQTQCCADTSRQLSCLFCTPRVHRGKDFSTLHIPEGVFTSEEFLDHHDEQTFSCLLHSKTLEMSLGVLCEKAESPRK